MSLYTDQQKGAYRIKKDVNRNLLLIAIKESDGETKRKEIILPFDICLLSTKHFANERPV